MKLSRLILFLVLALPLASACDGIKREDPEKLDPETATRHGVNYFAANCMSLYYLWSEEIDGELTRWLRQDINADPIEKVRQIRYKKDGKDYDRWTEVTDSYEEMSSSVEGVSTTYGCDIVLMRLDKTYICAVVTVVYADSPAAKAGLKRGDVISEINGTRMTDSNYYSLVTDGFLYSPSCKITLYDPAAGQSGQSVSMTAVRMYEDPVVHHSIFNVGDKKVGYLVFTSFTLDAIDKLVDVCEGFKQAGVSELILDLRYNGGGYVTTEEVLASMLAPEANVAAGDLLEQEVFNSAFTDYYIKEYGEDALKTFFKTQFSWGDGVIKNSCDTRGSHLDLNHLYAIIDEGTASASESLLVCLMPYLDITLIGQKSHGKFCTGIMYGAQEWYDDYKDEMSSEMYAYRKYVEDWGLYVMIGRYADKNGNCPAMPDGLTPDYEAEDRPDLGYGFGDERDPMLRQALILAGRTDLQAAGVSARTAAPAPPRMSRQIVKPAFGKRVLTLPAGRE